MNVILRQCVTVCLAPLLLLQGRNVRRSTPLLPEPPGARRGISGNNETLRLLITGDSAAAGVGASSQDEALLGQLVSRLSRRKSISWALEAKTGATTASTLKHLNSLNAEPFDIAVVSAGLNDVTSNTSRRNFLNNMEGILVTLRERFGVSRIVVCGIPPVGRFPALPQPLRWYLGWQGRHFDSALEVLVTTMPVCIYYRQPSEGNLNMMASDGFHPGPPVYAAWAENLVGLIAHDTVSQGQP
ncbi:MAG: SGNH/GDSL hydrolase family protein [Beijerinckiaceae bacterium]